MSPKSKIEAIHGDVLGKLPNLPDNSIDAVITDPPYEIGFMGKDFDSTGIAHNVEVWKQALRVLKPGGFCLAFGATRTYHRLACAIEDAGFEIRDTCGWVHAQGFPKSLNISKAIDREAGAEREVIGHIVRGDVDKAKTSGITMAAAKANRNNKDIFGYGVEDVTLPATEYAKQWDGWGTALKPAMELVVLARKPITEKTVASNVIKWGTGALNIDACRVTPTGESRERVNEESQDKRYTTEGATNFAAKPGVRGGAPNGRWPANIIHDGSDEVLAHFPESSVTGKRSDTSRKRFDAASPLPGSGKTNRKETEYTDSGSAARFFYCAKASNKERGEGNIHPTVKPIALMEYLIKLVTTEGATVLDPFMGSGTTGIACRNLGRHFIGIEKDEPYFKIATQRLADV